MFVHLCVAVIWNYFHQIVVFSNWICFQLQQNTTTNFSADIYLFKVNNNGNTRAMCKICLKLNDVLKSCSVVFIVNFKLCFFYCSLWNWVQTMFWCFHCWLWTSKYWLSFLSVKTIWLIATSNIFSCTSKYQKKKPITI